MKKILPLIILSMATLLSLGMGSLQEPMKNDHIPKPAKNFTVTYIDQMDMMTECTEASIEGNIFIEGKRGEGTYAVSFEKIKEVTFFKDKGQFKALLKLRDGVTIDLGVLTKAQRAYGKTKYGTFQIKLENVKKMIFGREIVE